MTENTATQVDIRQVGANAQAGLASVGADLAANRIIARGQEVGMGKAQEVARNTAVGQLSSAIRATPSAEAPGNFQSRIQPRGPGIFR